MVQPIRRLAPHSRACSSSRQASQLRSYDCRQLPGLNNHFPAMVSCSFSSRSFRLLLLSALLSALSPDRPCLALSRWLQSVAWDAEFALLVWALSRALQPAEWWCRQFAVFPSRQPQVISELLESQRVYSARRSSAW